MFSQSDILGFDYSYCKICKKWIIELPEIERLEKELKRLDPTKKAGKDLRKQLTQSKKEKSFHETH